MLVTHEEIMNGEIVKPAFPVPVVGSISDNVPTSGDVHLYADPGNVFTRFPILYADCEGLEGGESVPLADKHKIQDKERLQAKSLGSNAINVARTKLQKQKRSIRWAASDKEKLKREYAVAELYPRLLYTFSDVIVFVLRNSR